jgi:hypothetical protein
LARTLDDEEGGALLVQYIKDAHAEPLRKRRRMLREAIGGLFDLKLSLEDLSRARRAVQMLSPEDVLVLYGVWLIPGYKADVPPDPRVEYWERSGAESLESSGVIQLRTMSGFGAAGSTWMKISRTGMLILRALRFYLWDHPIPPSVPGHEPRVGATTDAAAREQLDGYAEAMCILREHVNHEFTHVVTFNGRAPDTKSARADAKSTLTLGSVAPGTGFKLRPLLSPHQNKQPGEPVRTIWVDEVDASYPGIEHVTLAGPDDVMRVLAYGLNAKWTM